MAFLCALRDSAVKRVCSINLEKYNCEVPYQSSCDHVQGELIITGIIPSVKRISVIFLLTTAILSSCGGNTSLWGQYLTPTPIGGIPAPEVAVTAHLLDEPIERVALLAGQVVHLDVVTNPR